MKIHEVLCEVSMSPSTIKKFATGPASQGIRAGFEAELCFKGKLLAGVESEPDYDYDERADDIDGIVRFFDAGHHNNFRAIRDLRSSLNDEYANWVTEQIDKDSEDDEDNYSETEWLRDQGYNSMSDILSSFSNDLEWPHWTEVDDNEYDNFNEGSAYALEQGLRGAIGNEFDVTVSLEYGDATRDDDTWIIEPDSSISADNSDDFAAEIISPPMDLNTCLEKLDSFANWAKSEGAYTNKSTGFHVGVSLPDIGGQVDYVKLAMFLGDDYILQQFGRAANTYTKRAAGEIEKHLTQRLQSSDQSQVLQNILATMHNGLMKQASNMIMGKNGDRYVTINMKSDYIEFRAMGGANYLDNIEQTKLTIMRYAYAMNIAGNPNLYKQEYAKKLYKFLNPEQRTAKPGSIDIVNLFARYSAGILTAPDLKQMLRNSRQLRQPVQQPAPTNTQGQWGRWFIKNQQGEHVHVFSARNPEEAYAKATEFINIASGGSALIDDFTVEPERS